MANAMEIVKDINARLDRIEAMLKEMRGENEQEAMAERFAAAIKRGATAEELLESEGLNTFAGMEKALDVFEENRELTRGDGNKVYNDLCRLHILERCKQLDLLRLGCDAEGGVARLAQHLEWDEVHRALQKFAVKLFNYKDGDLFFPYVIINEKYKYFKLHYAELEGVVPDCDVTVSFEGLTPYEAARAFREAIEPLAA